LPKRKRRIKAEHILAAITITSGIILGIIKLWRLFRGGEEE